MADDRSGASLLQPVRDAAYRLHQSIWSAWARRRYRRDFDGVARFCLFVGYPRSGHSIVGALVNAHRDAVISHELDAARLILDGCTRDVLFSRILARAYWFNLRGNTSNYSYQVPGQWQGRFRALRVIGDKRGGAVTRAIAADSRFLERVRERVAVPLRLIHVVRNPFDNIAAISIAERLSLEDSVDFYFDHTRTTAKLGDLCDPSELCTVRHEEMLRSPGAVLVDLCAFLGLEVEADYLEACRSIVFATPTETRHRVTWSEALRRSVERRMHSLRFLAGYAFAPSGPV